MKHYGDLEQYLGSKYAREIPDDQHLPQVYEESQAVLNGELDAMAWMNQAFLAVQHIGQRIVPRPSGPADATNN